MTKTPMCDLLLTHHEDFSGTSPLELGPEWPECQRLPEPKAFYIPVAIQTKHVDLIPIATWSTGVAVSQTDRKDHVISGMYTFYVHGGWSNKSQDNNAGNAHVRREAAGGMNLLS